MLIPISYFVPSGMHTSSTLRHGMIRSCSTITSGRRGGFKIGTMWGTEVSHLGVRSSYKSALNYHLEISIQKTSCSVGHIVTYLNQKGLNSRPSILLLNSPLRVIRSTIVIGRETPLDSTTSR